MKRVNVFAAIREMREQIVKTMQERGIKEIVTCMPYAEWCKENKREPEEDETDDNDYQDYINGDVPYVVFFDKYNHGIDYRVDKVTLKTNGLGLSVLEFGCVNDEWDYNDTFGEDDLVFLTLYNVYNDMLDLLGIEDEPEKLMVLCSYDDEEAEYDNHLIVSKEVFGSKDGKKRIRKYLEEAFEYKTMDDDDRKEFRECVKDLLKGKTGYFGIKYFWEETDAIL